MKPTGTVPASALTYDSELQVREHLINPYMIDRVVMALKAGVTVDPVIIWPREQATVVDGVQRVEAYRKLRGPDADVPVVEEHFNSSLEAELRAAYLNARHGQALTPVDMTRVIVHATARGATPEQLISTFAITEDRLYNLMRNVAHAPDGTPVPLKRITGHLANSTLTVAQVRGNDLAMVSLRRAIQQVLVHVHNDIINWKDPHNMEAIETLRNEIDVLLVRVQAA